jgi:cytochrome c biogenesis protein CcdA
MKHGRNMIVSYLSHPEKWGTGEIAIDKGKFTETLKNRFQQFTFIQIVLAGLVDGVNPCAIATMIFLISFLAVQKRKRGEILAIGLTFSAAVFVTYLFLGLGAFKAISLLPHGRDRCALVRRYLRRSGRDRLLP